jgi:succinate dehydrogenase hydrophobic anchor subunit
MNKPTIAPSPLMPPTAQKHSKLGIASFIIGIGAVLIICLTFVLIVVTSPYMVTSYSTLPADYIVPTVLKIIFLLFISLILSLIGLGLGIAAVVQKQKKKLFGIIGLMINLLFLLVFLGMVVVANSS